VSLTSKNGDGIIPTDNLITLIDTLIQRGGGFRPDETSATDTKVHGATSGRQKSGR
jgi:hypothetical protein